MSTKPHLIGFIGLDSYDLILFLAKYLENLGQSVLIADYSKFGRLSYCIPAPVSLNPKTDLIRYNNMDFLRHDYESFQREEYNYILIDFGWDISQEVIHSCDFLYIITDLQQQNMEHILHMNLPNISVYILLKNFFHINNRNNAKDYFVENHFNFKKCYLFPTSVKDLENMIMLQYYHDIKLHKVTKPLRNLIHTILIDNLDFDEKEVLSIKRFHKTK
jgi:hypothetical protein